MAEPMITIKKADGSTERVPLSQLQGKKQPPSPVTQEKTIEDWDITGGPAKAQAAPHEEEDPHLDWKEDSTNVQQEWIRQATQLQAEAPVEEVAPKSAHTEWVAQATQLAATEENKLPAQVQTHELATTTPVTDAFVDKAAARAWDAEDHVSPLEETLGKHADMPLRTLPKRRNDVLDNVLSRVSFTIAPDLHGRAESLIQSRMKDIRKDIQVKDYATKSSDENGLGLTPSQADELVAMIHEVAQIPEEPQEIPTVPEPKKEKKKSKPTYQSAVDKLIRTQSAGGGSKAVLHDILPPKVTTPPAQKRTVGPIDELQSYTLTDFRRLAQTVEQQQELMMSKFETLKNESYLLYMKGLRAWHHSPLFQVYASVVTAALSEGVELEEVLAREDQELQPEEFLAMVELGRGI